MGIQVVWDDDSHTCIRYDIRGSWTMGDLSTARQELQALTGDRQEKIVIIVDLRESQFVPEGMFTHFGSRSYNTMDDLGLMVFVGANALVRGLAASYQRIYRNHAMNWKFVDSLEGARQLIQEHLHAKSLLEEAQSSF